MNLNKILKRVLVSASALFIGFSAQAQHSFTVKGQLAKEKQGIIILSYQNNDRDVTDTAKVTKGKFVFKGEIGDPCYSSLILKSLPTSVKPEDGRLHKAQNDVQYFFLEAAMITVTGNDNIKTAKITGGKSQTDYTFAVSQYKPVTEQDSILQINYVKYKKEKNDTALQRISIEHMRLEIITSHLDSVFIRNYPDSYAAFDLWYKEHKGIVEPDLESEFKHFSAVVRNSYHGKILAAKLEQVKKLDVGNPAPDFTLKDTLGNPVSLSSLRGKNVMICFWTTDFMGFEPVMFNLGRINRRLHDKNFVMLTVYYNNTNKDRDTNEFWKSTVTSNNMNWLNVEDMNGFNKGAPVSPTAKAYGLHSMLLAYLIGPDGKILARHLDLMDNELSLKLEKLLK